MSQEQADWEDIKAAGWLFYLLFGFMFVCGCAYEGMAAVIIALVVLVGFPALLSWEPTRRRICSLMDRLA